MGIVLYSDINNQGKGEYFLGNLGSGTLFLSIGLTFALISRKICIRLHEFHYDYFEENKGKIIIATLGLSLPMLLRALFDYYKSLNGKIFVEGSNKSRN